MPSFLPISPIPAGIVGQLVHPRLKGPDDPTRPAQFCPDGVHLYPCPPTGWILMPQRSLHAEGDIVVLSVVTDIRVAQDIIQIVKPAEFLAGHVEVPAGASRADLHAAVTEALAPTPLVTEPEVAEEPVAPVVEEPAVEEPVAEPLVENPPPVEAPKSPTKPAPTRRLQK